MILIVNDLRHDSKGIPINSDGKAVYTLNVVATDHGKPQLSSIATVSNHKMRVLSYHQQQLFGMPRDNYSFQLHVSLTLICLVITVLIYD